MKIIPSDKIDMTTTLSIEEVRKIVRNNILPKKVLKNRYKLPENREPFEGSFEQDCFEIQRIVIGRNSFVPEIKGKIYPNSNGTKLMANLKISSFVIAFLILWTSLVIFFFIIGIMLVTFKGKSPLFLIIPLGMMLFMFVLMHLVFSREKDKTIKELKRLLKTQD